MNLSVRKRLGSIIFSLEGSGEIYEEITKEIASLPEAGPHLKPDIVYQFLSKNKAPGGNKLRTKFYDIYMPVGVTTNMALSPQMPFKDTLIGFLAESMQRVVYCFGIKRLFSINELLSAVFFYEVFGWTTQCLLMKKGESYIHASAVTDANNDAYIFAGAQHSGKTVISHSLLLENNHYRALSDDRLVVNNRGKGYFTEGHTIIAPTLLSLSNELRIKFFENLSRSEKITWNLFRMITGSEEIAKRMHISRIYNDNSVTTEAHIKYCFYLVRTDVPQLKANKITAEDFSLRSSRDICAVINYLSDYAYAFNVDPGQIQERVAAIHRSALANAECFELLIPFKISPLELGNFIKDFISGITHKS